MSRGLQCSLITYELVGGQLVWLASILERDHGHGHAPFQNAVVIRNGRIEPLGPSAAIAVPDGAEVVSGHGQFLMPGLWDIQAVTEGIWRFVLERNQVQADRDRPALAATLVERKVLTEQCAEAFARIWRSVRNDVHHMNPSVSAVPFRDLAKRNLMDLATIEREIFAVGFDNGKLVPVQPLYWDLGAGGTTVVFLRNP